MPVPHTYLACHDCGLLIPLAHNPEGGGNEADMELFSAYEEFRTQHSSHRTEQLWRHGSESVADRPLWDPLVRVTFEITDGEHHFLVSTSRSSIEEPRTYRFTPGTLLVRNAEVDVDTHDVERGLDREFYPHVLRASQLESFVAVLREVVSHIDPGDLEIAFDAADDPAVSVARMPEESYEELVARCATIFPPWEWLRLLHFLRENRNEDGVLALRVRRNFSTLSA